MRVRNLTGSIDFAVSNVNNKIAHEQTPGSKNITNVLLNIVLAKDIRLY